MIAALLAARTGRPVRFAYTRTTTCGGPASAPVQAVYRAGFDVAGRLTAVDVKLYSNGGCSTDLSFAVLERAMLHLDHAYYLPNVRIEGRVCRTNLPSNTAFRGFGGPQGVAAIENILEEVATALGIDALDVRRANLYGVDDRNVTHYGQLVRNNTLPRLFDAIRDEADYDARRRAIAGFNEASPTHLKGLAVSAVKFGISFTRRTMNQANALVNVYQDGSVIVSTGATEMGQGVNTRIRQVVADALGVPYSAIVVTAPTRTRTTTLADGGERRHGPQRRGRRRRMRADPPAARGRRRGMLARPADGLAAEPDRITFADGRAFDARAPQRSVSSKDVCCAAYEARVSLGERGFYATPGVDFNRETGKGSPFCTTRTASPARRCASTTSPARCPSRGWTSSWTSAGRSTPASTAGRSSAGSSRAWVGDGEELVYGPRANCCPLTDDVQDPERLRRAPRVHVRFLDNPAQRRELYRSKPCERAAAGVERLVRGKGRAPRRATQASRTCAALRRRGNTSLAS
jgi:xanthine dehydrogenase large subunit